MDNVHEVRLDSGKQAGFHGGGHENALSLAFSLSLMLHAIVLSMPNPWEAIKTKSIAGSGLAASPVFSATLTMSKSLRQEKISSSEGHWTKKNAHPDFPVDSISPPNDKHAEAAITAIDYLLARELTRSPELIGGVSNEADFFNANDATGQLLLRLIIGKDGRVKYVQVLQSSLPKVLEDMILLRFYLANYRAGEVNGTPVSAEMFVQVDYGSLP